MPTMWNGLGERVRLNRFPDKLKTVADAVNYLKATFYPSSLGTESTWIQSIA